MTERDSHHHNRNTDPDCPPSNRGDLLPGTPQTTAARDALDAARYRWLRAQNWLEDDIVVVRNPKQSVKLGSECPSGQMLDEAIDTALKGFEGQPQTKGHA